ncbi:MAG: hypothetical protein AAB019_08520 [Planctomycetota bacterium]
MHQRIILILLSCSLLLSIIVLTSVRATEDQKTPVPKQSDKPSEPTKPPAPNKTTTPEPAEKQAEPKTEKLSELLTPLPVVTEYQDVKNRLDSLKITVDLLDVPFEEAVEYFRIIGGINFIIDRRIYEDGKKPKNVTLQFKKTTLGTVLKFMIMLQGYRCIFKQGSLLILPEEIYDDDEFVTLTYNIPDLLAPPPPDFPGPSLALPSAVGGNIWRSPPLEKTPREPLTEDDIKEAVQVKTGQECWEAKRTAWTIIRKQFLVVTQTMDAHKQIAETLNELRMHKR